GPGLTFMWQLLHRPVVPSMISGIAPVKFAWKLACAHSAPWIPGVWDGPTCVWQRLHSFEITLMSAWWIWSRVPTGTPVVGSLLAVVKVLESVRPLGRVLSMPGLGEPLWRAWHAEHDATPGIAAWSDVVLLHTAPEALASARWQAAQSLYAASGARWLIHCKALDEVPPVMNR